MRATSPIAGARTVGGSLAALAGLLLLAALAPHRTPWDRLVLESPGADGWTRLLLPGPLGALPAIPLLLLVALLAVLLLAGLTGRRDTDRRQGAAPAPGRIAAAAAAVALLGGTLYPSDRGRELILGLALGSVAIALVWVGAAHWWRRPGGPFGLLRRTVVSLVDRPSPLRFDLALFAWTVLASSLTGKLLFDHLPHVIDGMVQLFHAKMLAQGELAVAAPGSLEFFHISHMIDSGRWYSQYPPGHVLFLALGQLARLPWLVNPLAGAASVVLIHRAGRRLYDERTGRVAALLAAGSPFLLLISASHMNHGTTMLCLSLFLWALARMRDGGGPIDAGVAGLALGAAATIRPWTAASFALPFGIALLFGLWSDRSADSAHDGPLRRWGLPLLLAAAMLLPLAGMLAWNQATTGDPLVFGYQALHGDDHLPGFGRTGFWSEPHTAARGLQFTLRNLNALNQYLFGWPLPSLALPLLGLLAVRRRAIDGWLLAAAAGPIVAYFFYWYQDWAFGPRFYFETLGVWALLSARALLALPSGLHRLAPRLDRESWSRGVVAGLALCGLHLLLVTAPAFGSFYGRNFGDGNRAAVAAVRDAGLDDAVVFVPAHLHPAVFFLNSPDLDGPVVVARDHGPGPDRELLRQFPGRKGYRLLSLDGYRLLSLEDGPPVSAPIYPVEPERATAIEFSSVQLSHLRAEFRRDDRMGRHGPGWRNHDQLFVASRSPGAEVGIQFRVDRPSVRDLSLVLGRGPSHGRVELALGGRPLGRPVELYAPRPRTERLTFDGVQLPAGDPWLTIRVVGKDPRSEGYGMGLDELRLELPTSSASRR